LTVDHLETGGAKPARAIPAFGARLLPFGVAEICHLSVPFRSEHGLGPDPDEEAAPLERLDRQTRGSLFHEIQKRFIPNLGAYPEGPEALQEACELLDATLQDVAAEYAEELAPAIDEIWKNEIERLRADLRSWLLTVSTENQWAPVEVERTFEDVVIEGMWRLRGRMDLTEQSTDGLLRITDYKTGAFPKEPPEITGAARSCNLCCMRSLLSNCIREGRLLAGNFFLRPCAAAIGKSRSNWTTRRALKWAACSLRSTMRSPPDHCWRPPVRKPVRTAITSSCAGLMKRSGFSANPWPRLNLWFSCEASDDTGARD